MRYCELVQIANYLKRFKRVSAIFRVDDNVIKIDFGKESIYFDLSRGDSKIYKRDDFIKTKKYFAPFDIVLQKKFTKSKILDLTLLPNDKIITIKAQNASSYKKEIAILELEFTGRNTNAIILDENGVVIEALRHIDESVSFREVKPGKKLLPLPPLKKIKKCNEDIEDVEKYLYEVYEKKRQKELDRLKSIKSIYVEKQIEKLKKILNSLENESELKKRADEEELKANLILANMQKIAPYDKVVELEDFEGKKVKIELPKEAKSVAQMADIFFNRARKYRQKAKNIHIERENLTSKIIFLQRVLNRIKNANRIEDITILFPKKKSFKSKKIKSLNYEKFVIDGYEVYVGKNEKGNEELLKKSKSNDIWIHLKNIPSSHVIIKTNKKQLPNDVLVEAAKLCVDFSVDSKGDYLVDYTQRRNVKIKEKAFVNYVNYKTIKIRKV